MAATAGFLVLSRTDWASRQPTSGVLMVDGRVIEREVGLALITVRDRTVATVCIFGEVESMLLLGAVSLEELGLAADPVQKRLVPVIGYALASA